MKTQELEVWKTIENFPDYMISNIGRVKSLGNDKTKKEKIMKQSINNRGYFFIGLNKDKKQKMYLVHRLVASAFIPNPNNYPCVNHKDENKQNNHISNLEWVTQKENCNYGTRNERSSKSRKGMKRTQEHRNNITKTKRDKKILNRMKDIFTKLLELRRQVS